MSITLIRVPSSFYSHASDPTLGEGYVIRQAEFRLGPGPCGKTVERLDIVYHSFGVEIVQVCTCTEQKNFIYPWNQLTGRLEVTHG